MMMTCKTATELHTDAREGALVGFRRLRYRTHMAICPYCSAYEKGFGETISALSSLPKEPAPEDTKQAALSRLKARSQKT